MAKNCIPIKKLVPSLSCWTIYARILKKAPKRQWSNDRGSGSLFNATLVDNKGDQIMATFFNEAADKFYDHLVQGATYTFSKGVLKPSNARFQNFKNDYALTFYANAVIEHVEDVKRAPPELKFNFTTIKDTESIKNAPVDV